MKQNSVESGFINAGAAAWIPPTTTFASAPQSPATGSVYLFTDALSPGAVTGGGTSLSTCRWSGSAWVSASAGPPVTIQDEGVILTQRATLNFVGAGVTATDDANNGRTVVTIPGASQTPWTQDIDGAGFKLTNTGNVGIGNATTPFSAAGYIHLNVGPATSSAQSGIITACSNTASTNQAVGEFVYANFSLASADKRIASIRGDADGSADSGRIVFNTWNAGVVADRMHITAKGYVGIGNPASTLPVNVPGYTWLIVGPTGVTTTCGLIVACGNTASMGAQIGSFQFANYSIIAAEKRIATIDAATDGAIDSGMLRFTTFVGGIANERVRITAAGLVGVGTASPPVRLSVTNPTIGGPVLGSAKGCFSVLSDTPAWGLFFGALNDGTSWIQAQRADGSATAYALQLNPLGGAIQMYLGGSLKTLSVDGSGFVKAT